jgi:hypothetical protein
LIRFHELRNQISRKQKKFEKSVYETLDNPSGAMPELLMGQLMIKDADDSDDHSEIEGKNGKHSLRIRN